VTFSALKAAAMRGLRKVVWAQLAEAVLRPALLILAVFLAFSLNSEYPKNPTSVMQLHLIAAALVTIFAFWFLRRIRPKEVDACSTPVYESRQWFLSALSMALATSLQMINQYADILMLGVFREAHEVGVYKVAVHGAGLVAFGLQAVNLVVAPHFARLHEQGDKEKLQRLATVTARVSFSMALPLAVVFAVWGNDLLKFVFGSQYVEGSTALAILALGQLGSTIMGSVGFLLTMTGNERDVAIALGCSAISNLIMNSLLIPWFGMNGAAVATAVTIGFWNLLMWKKVRCRLGINSTVFSRPALC
jgi:O-antigen/teichoic acid export membrane protein